MQMLMPTNMSEEEEKTKGKLHGGEDHLVLGGFAALGMEVLIEEFPPLFGKQVEDRVVESIDNKAICCNLVSTPSSR